MHKQHGILSSLLLALVLAAGTAIVWGVVSGFCGDVIRQRQLRQRPGTERVYEHLVVAEDGTPLVATITYLDRQYRTYRTLDGELVESATLANIWLAAGARRPGTLQPVHRVVGIASAAFPTTKSFHGTGI